MSIINDEPMKTHCSLRRKADAALCLNTSKYVGIGNLPGMKRVKICEIKA